MNVGYRVPAKGGPFKKGQSGHQRGRPRQTAQPVSAGYLFRKVANEPVAIEVDREKVMMTRWEALLREIHILALNDDASAARLLDQIRRQFPANPAPGDRQILVVSDNDMKL